MTTDRCRCVLCASRRVGAGWHYYPGQSGQDKQETPDPGRSEASTDRSHSTGATVAAHPSLPDGTVRAPARHRCECPRAECGLRNRGLMRGRRVAGLDCDQPLVLHMSCGWVWVKCCGSYSCKPCTAKTRRRKQRVIGDGMQAQTRSGRRLWLLTLTAPGERAHKRWVPADRWVRGMRRRDCDCHQAPALEDWNPTAGQCWNRLRTALARHVDVEYYRATEVQDRGALHHHVIVASSKQLDAGRLQLLALAAGYGCVLDLRPIRSDEVGSIEHTAEYVMKSLAGYVTKSAGSTRAGVPWRRDVLDDDTGEVRRLRTVATYRLSSQSAGWGRTEAEVRAHNRAQAIRRAELLEALGLLMDLDGNLVTLGSDEPLSAGAGPPT